MSVVLAVFLITYAIVAAAMCAVGAGDFEFAENKKQAKRSILLMAGACVWPIVFVALVVCKYRRLP